MNIENKLSKHGFDKWSRRYHRSITRNSQCQMSLSSNVKCRSNASLISTYNNEIKDSEKVFAGCFYYHYFLEKEVEDWE